MPIQEIIEFIATYKYIAIFPIAVAEGPIITIVSGFLVSIGHLSFLPALIIVFLGDVFSDLGFYYIGRGGRHMMAYFKFKKIPEEQIQKLETQFETSPWKTMIVGKVSYGLGSAFMAASGASRMPLKLFLEYMLSLNFIRSFILLTFGFYFGKLAIHLGTNYLKYYTVLVIVLIPTIYFVYKKLKKSEL